MKIHHLKISSEHFKPLNSCQKKGDIRLDDRNFKKGDIIKFGEYERKIKKYTGNFCYRWITHITNFPEGMKEGYVLLSLGKFPKGVSLE
jgi:hypothetical protein